MVISACDDGTELPCSMLLQWYQRDLLLPSCLRSGPLPRGLFPYLHWHLAAKRWPQADSFDRL